VPLGGALDDGLCVRAHLRSAPNRDIERTSQMTIVDRFIRLIGWRFLAVNSDPLVTDRVLFLSPWLLGPASELRTLDAGCGNGAFSFQAAWQSRGSVLGVSDDRAAIDKAATRSTRLGFEKVEFRHFDLRWYDRYEELGEFDQILLLETVEHVVDDTKLIRCIASRLKVGGRLLLTTPSHDHSPLFGEGRHLSGGIEDGRHVRWGYSADELNQLVESAGLQVAYIGPVGGALMRTTTSMMWRLSRLIGRPAAMVITAPLRFMRPIDPFVTRFARIPSHCWGLVAIRPPSAVTRRHDDACVDSRR
jgi:2-polyprenyl-3-methyl-5-hydroxy-6-metoxy-1,4-benzoquinol methylase